MEFFSQKGFCRAITRHALFREHVQYLEKNLLGKILSRKRADVNWPNDQYLGINV